MLLKYANQIFIEFFEYNVERNGILFVITQTCVILSPICHWVYASQYVKTCFLALGMVKKARLLLARHLTIIEDEFKLNLPPSDFIKRHTEID